MPEPILNKLGVRRAKKIAAETGKLTFKQHGKISDFIDDPTSYFIVKIGNCTVVEGTHSFAMKIYDRNNDFIPPMHSKTYQKKQFRGFDKRVVHHPQGTWQNEALKVFTKLRR